MKHYALYVTNASNYNRLILKNSNGQPFKTKQEAHEYGNNITNNTVAIIELTDFYVLHS